MDASTESTTPRPAVAPKSAERRARRTARSTVVGRTRGDRFRRALPWLVFSVGFLLTTGIGASIIGASGGERWGINPERSLDLGLNTKDLDDSIYTSVPYWTLLLVCFLVPFAGAIAAMLTRPKTRQTGQSAASAPGFLRTARFLYFVGIAWLMLRVAVLVPNPQATIYGAWTGAIEQHYQVRYLVMSLLSRTEFGLAYTGLLALLAVPLYQALMVRRTTGAWLEVMVWYAAYWCLAVVLIQKLLISFSLLVLGLAILSSGSVGRYWKRLLMIALFFFALIHGVMSTLVETWSWSSTIDHIIGRSADSYPFAIGAGQQHPFSVGQYLVGSVLGGPSFLGQPANPNTDLYFAMYPDSEGAVTLAAPIWSFFDVGMTGAIITLILVCGLCAVGTVASRWAHASPWSWAIYLLLLVQAYHLTQIPILGVLFWSYGIFYGLATIGIAWLTATVAGKHSPPRPTVP